MNEFSTELLETVDEETAKQVIDLAEQLASGSPVVTRDRIQEVIESASSMVFVTRNENGTIVGMATLVMINKLQGEKKAVIEDVVVDEKMRGKGLGKQLINKALDEARKQNVKLVTLTSRPSREGANIMYQKMGFERYETNNYKYVLGSK